MKYNMSCTDANEECSNTSIIEEIEAEDFKTINKDMTLDELEQLYINRDFISIENILRVMQNYQKFEYECIEENMHDLASWMGGFWETCNRKEYEYLAKQYVCEGLLSGTCTGQDCIFRHVIYVKSYKNYDALTDEQLSYMKDNNIQLDQPLNTNQREELLKYISNTNTNNPKEKQPIIFNITEEEYEEMQKHKKQEEKEAVEEESDENLLNKYELIMFYTTWCGYCAQLMPVWDQLTDLYSQSNDLKIKKINFTNKDLYKREYPYIQGYPAITFTKLYEEPIVYMGSRTLESLEDFIYENIYGETDDSRATSMMKINEIYQLYRSYTDEKLLTDEQKNYIRKYSRYCRPKDIPKWFYELVELDNEPIIEELIEEEKEIYVDI